MTGDDALFRVTFVRDYATVSTVVAVPYHESDDGYDDDESAIDVAIRFLLDEYAWDVSHVRNVDADGFGATDHDCYVPLGVLRDHDGRVVAG